jgi:peptidoglycan hydrolase-like amidase
MERVAGGRWRAINLNNIVRHSQRLKEQGIQFAQVGTVTTATDLAAIMRVAVVVDGSALAIAGSHGLILRSVQGEVLSTLPQMQNFSVSALSGVLIVGDRSGNQHLSQMFFVEPAQPGGLVAVNRRWYRGRVLVGMRPGGLIAVNWVGMEDYLKSVVGSEMIPSWPIHALKAQAIAARSYALAHRLRPANRNWFDLLSTPRHQAYRGVEAETRSTNQAVTLTRGMILSATPAFMQQYRPHAVNGVVEALYASTQDIVNDVHNGFGLSQWGAASLAQQGDSYLRILGFYYPETAIVRIY